jgi:hypothetical protein
MATLTLDSYTTVPDGVYPFYTSEKVEEKKEPIKNVVKTSGGLDSSTMARTPVYVSPTPNALCPLDEAGKFPASTMPDYLAFPSAITKIDTLANLKASAVSGIYFAWATDIGAHGALFVHTNNTLIGDSGFLFVSGS